MDGAIINRLVGNHKYFQPVCIDLVNLVAFQCGYHRRGMKDTLFLFPFGISSVSMQGSAHEGHSARAQFVVLFPSGINIMSTKWRTDAQEILQLLPSLCRMKKWVDVLSRRKHDESPGIEWHSKGDDDEHKTGFVREFSGE